MRLRWVMLLGSLCLLAIDAHPDVTNTSPAVSVVNNRAPFDYNPGFQCPAVTQLARSSVAFRILKQQWFEWDRVPHWTGMESGLSAPQSEYVTEHYETVDVLRQIYSHYRDATIKPRLGFGGRVDAHRRMKTPDSSDPRFGSTGQGCPSGTHSFQTATTKTCTAGSVPMCVGGTRDSYWCPIDQGNTYCPTGTCTLVPFDWSWAWSMPAADHASQLAEFTSVTLHSGYDDDYICDGTLGSGCGAGYPAGPPDASTASVGYELYIDGGSVWPLLNLPMYYGNADRVVNGGADDDTYSFEVNAVYLDLRNSALREWKAAEFLDAAYHKMNSAEVPESAARIWPLVMQGLAVKTGWWTYYDPALYPADTPSCTSSTLGSNMYEGPAHPYAAFDDAENWACMSASGPAHETPYGPGEYQTATAELAKLMLAQTTAGKFCSPTSHVPYLACSVDADCFGPGATCDAAITNYFSDVWLMNAETPGYRNRNNVTWPPAIQRNPRYAGYRARSLSYGKPPFQTTAPHDDGCPTVPYVFAGGPYQLSSGASTRLAATCTSPTAATGWSIVSPGTACTFLDPFTGSPSAADPQALLSGCTSDGVIRFTCGTETSDAIVDVL